MDAHGKPSLSTRKLTCNDGRCTRRDDWTAETEQHYGQQEVEVILVQTAAEHRYADQQRP